MADLAVTVFGRGGSISQIQPPSTTLAALVTETLHTAAGTVSRAWDCSGITSFMASTGHATITHYTARLRLSGSSTIIATANLGKPTPDGNFVIQMDLSFLFAYRAPGDYTVSILATDPGDRRTPRSRIRLRCHYRGGRWND